MVGELVEVALDMTRRQRRGTVGEDGIDIVPGQQGTVKTTGDTRPVARLRHRRGHTGERPLLRTLHTDIVLRILKVVDIGGIILRTAGRTRDQLGKLTRESDVRGLLHMQEGDLVEHRGQPLRLLFPVHVQTPDRVAQWLRAHRHLRGQRLFREVHQRTAYLQVLREVVLPVHTQHRLSLHAVVSVRLERSLDIRLRIQDALVDDGHLTSGVIDGVVGAFL